MKEGTTAQRLGYPADARLLIVNADDFGMCQSENAATMAGLNRGAFDTTTVMVPCPWFPQAADYLRDRPTVDAGVHVTHTSEWAGYKWGAVAETTAVASLLDPNGHFWPDVPSLYARADSSQVEAETRAQIERALGVGIDVTHLDSHMGTVQLDPRLHEMYLRLAATYQLPARMMSREGLRAMGWEHIAQLAEDLGVVTPDTLWIGGPKNPAGTPDYWRSVLRTLPPGVTEIYVHAGFDTPELRSICPEWAQRVADFEFFIAESTRALLADLGIVRTGYRALRTLQRGS